MKTTFFWLFMIFGFLKAEPLAGQEIANQPPHSLFNYLYTATDSIIDIELETDLRMLVRHKLEEEYQPAEFTFQDKDRRAVTWEAKVRSRGNIRKEVCYYPPIRLNVKKGDLRDFGLNESDKIKLVCQCRSGSANEEYVFREYLTYKLYAMLTPVSYRVQLLRINFRDPEGKKDPEVMYGFMIEPDEDLAERLNGQIVEREGANSFMMEGDPYRIMAVFQYMVGNTDWSPVNLHNLTLVKLPDFRKVHAIPYDFDYCGLVNTSYAIPAENSQVEHVRERFYNGLPCTEAETDVLIRFFESHEAQILGYCRQFPHLDDRSKRDIVQYLEDFFDLLDKKKVAYSIFHRK